MRKILVLSFVLVSFLGNAQIPKDSLVMTVGDKQISLAEFEFIARKNNGVNLSDENSLKEYVELFKNFKLKVAEAEELGLDKRRTFANELGSYKVQLEAGYLSDKKAEEAAAKQIYDRGDEYLVLSQIILPLTGECLAKDTVEVYEQAMQVYNRIQSGEDFDKLGAELHHAYLHHSHDHGHEHGEDCDHGHEHDENCIHATYGIIPCFLPMEHAKTIEEIAYSMKVGDISKPFRTKDGYHLIKIQNRKPNPGLIRVSHLLIQFGDGSIVKTKEEAKKLAEEIYTKAANGEELLSLIEAYSLDSIPGNGVLPPIKPGELISELEDELYALAAPGEVSKPSLTEYGYHIFQLLDRYQRAPFEQEKGRMIAAMNRDDRNFDLYRELVERLKKEYNYTFYPEAYAELEKLSEEYFPNSNDFFAKARPMEKTLVTINGIDFPQVEFAYYMNSYGFSGKTYAGDFMKEVFDLFVRDIVTTLEKDNLESKYPEIPFLIQEYRDGMLLFEISNTKIWDKPLEEQAALEKEWLKELNNKYPVSVNWELLKKLKK